MNKCAFGFLALSIFAIATPALAGSTTQCIRFNGKLTCDDGSSYPLASGTNTPSTQAIPDATPVDTSAPRVVQTRQRCRTNFGATDCWTEQRVCWEPSPGYTHCEWQMPNNAANVSGYGYGYGYPSIITGIWFGQRPRHNRWH